MNSQVANFAADLRRIAYWIYSGQDDLAEKMLGKTKELYAGINPKIGCYENIWGEVDKIKSYKSKQKSAETALTASIILLQNSRLESKFYSQFWSA
jgi:hypothetical protein